MFKVYRINTKTNTVCSEDFKEDYKFFGNRGLIAKVMTNEVNPKCDPLGSENKLIICTGILAGTAVPTAHRLSVGAKSPLTGGIKESNVGGNVAYLLAQHGIKMIIFEEIPINDKWHILKINADGSVELESADEYIGLNNYALVEKLHNKYGNDIGVLSIGVAGERKSKISTLQATDATTKHPSRAAARGGLGAVAGSKKIKAIVVEKPKSKFEFPYIDKEVFDKGNKKFVKCLSEGMAAVFHSAGTVCIINATMPTGITPVRNYSGMSMHSDEFEKINTKAWLEKVNANGGKQGVPCQPGCVIRCSNIYNNSRGECVTSGLEYETYALCGPNCGISSIDYIAEFDKICDDFGVDTIEVGCLIGVMMDNGKIPWGDEASAMDIINQMVEGKTELSQIMAQGTEYLGKAIGAKRIPTVKGQSMAGYDPRNLKGTGITYATSAMGADHTAGMTMAAQTDHTDKKGQIGISQGSQIHSAAGDNLMCSFAFDNGFDNDEIYPQIMKGAFGGDWSTDMLIELGKHTLKMEWAWNKAAGFTEEDNRMPEFFIIEPSPTTGALFDISTEEMEKIFKF